MNKYELLGIGPKISELAEVCEEELKDIYKKIEEVCEYNSMKVLGAFQEQGVNEMDTMM